MTDMHREAFERWCERRGISTSPEHRTYEYQQAYEDWQAALRYRDEQKQCECAYTCKFCRDEQEKQA